jgi:hypothetical protein
MAVYCDNCNNILDITRTVPKSDLFDDDTLDTVSSIKSTSIKTSDNTSDKLSDKSSNESSDESSDKSSDKSSNQSDNESDDESDNQSDNQSDDLSDDSEYDETKELYYQEILKKLQNGEQPTEDELRSIDMKEIIKTEYYKKMNGKGQIKTTLINMIDDLSNSDTNTKVYHICNNCLFSKQLDPGFHVLTKNQEGVVSSHDYENEEVYRNMVYQRTKPRTRAFICPNKSCPSIAGSKPSEACFFRKQGTYELIYVCTLCHTIKRN